MGVREGKEVWGEKRGVGDPIMGVGIVQGYGDTLGLWGHPGGAGTL